MPAENGLPQYVSKNARSGFYQYYRRPPTGVAGSAFVRSFGSKDRKAVREKYASIHAEAEVYFARLISGRAIPDFDLKVAAMALGLSEIVKDGRPLDGSLLSPKDFLSRLHEIEPHSAARLSEADAKALLKFTMQGYLSTEGDRVAEAEQGIAAHRHALRAASTPAPTPKEAFTLRMAFDQAWMPAKNRSLNSVTEVGRYVDEFEALNGVRDLGEYDRTHWAAWRKDCLDRHGPGATAFKRFSMMKTVCNEAIRAGLFERKNFHGQDVSMAKIKGKKLRNEGWLPDELTKWFSQPVFKGEKSGPHADADYWASVIIAYTGAAIIEVSHMDTAEIVQRHGFWTMRLWRDKSHNSDRIIPIPKQVLDLGFLDYVRSRPKNSPLFMTKAGERVSNKNLSQQFSRLRQKAGITRKGADAHAYRHHIKTLLPDVGCPDRVSDYITGHAPPNVGRTYGKVEFKTAREYLDKVDLGVKIQKWKGAD